MNNASSKLERFFMQMRRWQGINKSLEVLSEMERDVFCSLWTRENIRDVAKRRKITIARAKMVLERTIQVIFGMVMVDDDIK